jgi:hypothetical protein
MGRPSLSTGSDYRATDNYRCCIDFAYPRRSRRCYRIARCVTVLTALGVYWWVQLAA